MRRIVLFVLVFGLCVDGTLQKKGRRRNRTAVTPAVAHPRVFLGDPVTPVNLTVLNITRASGSPGAPGALPALGSLSNTTMSYLRGPLSTRVIPAIYLLAVAVGIPANLAVLVMLASKVRTVSSAVLYCSLAVSDLLLLLSLLFKAHYHLHGNRWLLGEAACRAVTACFYGNLYCSALTLACINVKRYLAVVHPFVYRSLPKRALASWVALAVWGVFAAAAVPELAVRQSYWLPEVNRVSCHDVLPLRHASHGFLLYHTLFLTAVGLVAPLAVTVLSYAAIVCELRRSQHDWSLYVKASSLVLGIFLVCFTPAGVLHFLHYVQLMAGGTERLYVHFKMAVCLCCLHACLDPFLFALMSKSAGSRHYFRPFRGKTVSLSL